MSEEVIALIVAALGGGGLTTLFTALFNRRKVNADATKIITDATKEILGEYRQRNDELEEEVKSLKSDLRILREELKETKHQYYQEQALQDVQIENTNAKVLKLELVNIILVSQMRQRGMEPLIDPRQVDNITIDELRDIANGTRSIEQRRQSAKDTRRRGGDNG